MSRNQPDSPLGEYRDQWSGFADTHVIVAGTNPVELFHNAQASGKHPYLTCVGHEHEPNRMRRAALGASKKIIHAFTPDHIEF